MSSEPSSFKDWAVSFWGHIDELTRRFKVVLVTLIITTSIGWLPTSLIGSGSQYGLYQPLISLLMLRLKSAFLPAQASLIAGHMADTVFVMAYLSIILGVLLASPVIFYEIIAFVRPALYDNEKRVLGRYLGSFIGLLILGGIMAYFLIIPVSFKILIYFTLQGGAAPLIFISDFYSWIYTIFIICGIFYTVPLLLVLLVHIGILPVKYLRGRNKLFIYLGILMIFWIFGPDPTPITGSIMLAPFIVVFELASFFAGRIDTARKKRKDLEAHGFTQPPNFIALSVKTCKFCKSPIKENVTFCPNCNRSTK
jgi:sec-independent protein translocase protein TatC